jgi:AAA+ superfamily predicted ATPase
MPRADLLLALVRASARSDSSSFRQSLEAIIAEERAKQHNVLADRLAEYVAPPTRYLTPNTPAPQNGSGSLEAPAQYLLELQPRRRLDELVLTDANRSDVEEFLEEQNRQDLLRSFGLEPRHKILLWGPPGNGKTSLAEAIAEALALPLLVVRYEGVIGSYLGETALRLSRVFEFVRLRHCVLFLDEFDTLGKERGDAHDTGEIKRVVSSLLLQIDALPAYVVVVAATNHPELLDRAVRRRFDLGLELAAPNAVLLDRWLVTLEQRLGQPLAGNRPLLTRTLSGASYSDLEAFALDVLRRRALAPDATTEQVLRSRLKRRAKTSS